MTTALGSTAVQIATTATYVTGNSTILTNQVYGTNITNSAIYPTNSNSGTVIVATTPYQLFITNASYAISGFSGP